MPAFAFLHQQLISKLHIFQKKRSCHFEQSCPTLSRSQSVALSNIFHFAFVVEQKGQQPQMWPPLILNCFAVARLSFAFLWVRGDRHAWNGRALVISESLSSSLFVITIIDEHEWCILANRTRMYVKDMGTLRKWRQLHQVAFYLMGFAFFQLVLT